MVQYFKQRIHLEDKFELLNKNNYQNIYNLLKF
jgi:hypothetical protein